MFKSVRRHTLIVLTLLAMLSQGLMTNGLSMVRNAEAHEAMMPESHDSDMMSMEDGANYHSEQTSNTAHCCDTEQNEVLPGTAQNCCDGDEFCQGNCSHCLVISVTGTLFHAKSWPGFSPSQHAMATQMPYFHSISLTTDLKPPIA